ncbi:MAG: DUF2339 domain-containing protein [Burkholderiales bacterium]|nr:DUF2339 domain-containing protein [Burkholderiales bacterium]
MWLFGGIIGFLIGSALESIAAVIVLTLLGSYLGHRWKVSREAKTGGNSVKQAVPSTVRKPELPLSDRLTILTRKLTLLESRVQTLESELAALKAETTSDATPAAEQVVTVATVDDKDADIANHGFIAENAAQIPSASAAAASVAALSIKMPDASAQILSVAPELPSNKESIQQEPSPASIPMADAILSTAPLPEEPQFITTKTDVELRTLATPAQPRPAIAPVRPLRERLPAPLANLIFGGNALVKVGVLILFLGLAFLLRYTAERVTVPIELRYAGVACTGAGLLALGWFLRQRRRDYALILQGMAIGVFYLTTLSAMKLHDLITPGAGFGFMLAVSVLSAALAVLQNAPMLAIVAALEGFATPILASTGENRPLALFTYLAVLDIGIFLVAWFNAWRVLNLIGFVGTFTLVTGWAQRYYTDDQYGVAQAFLIFFFVLFALIGLLFARRTLQEATSDESPLSALKRVGRVDSALTFGNPITAFGLQYLLVRHTEFGAAFSAIAVGFFYLLLARLVFSREKHGLHLLAEAYAIVAGIFGTMAIPLGLEGAWTGAAWAVEGAGMYWLGTRQQRPYARGAAYAVLAGATCKLLQSLHIDVVTDGNLVHGPSLGPVLLAASALTVWHWHRRNIGDVAHWEAVPGRLLPWLAMASLGLLPWLWLTPQFAAAADAVLALVVAVAAQRFALPVFNRIASVLQAVALAAFVVTLHLETSADSHAALADGWKGMLAAIVIAGSILLRAGQAMLARKRQAMAQGLPASWSGENQLAVVSGCVLLHLAMLFGLDWQQAALVWPLSSCLLLWVALRMSHNALALLAGQIQLISALLFVLLPSSAGAASFAHIGFYVPLALAFAALLSADWIRAEAVRALQARTDLPDATGAESAPALASNMAVKNWLNLWSENRLLAWIPLLWGIAWWLDAWFSESIYALEQAGQVSYVPSAGVLISVASAVLLYGLATWRNWRQSAISTMITLPLLIACALLGALAAPETYLPSSALGWLAWPLALVWHLGILRWQLRWLEKAPAWLPRLAGLHVAGFWFFLLQAAREGQARLGAAGDIWSSWSLLGWVLVPAIVFWCIGGKRIAQRWPLNTYRQAYVELACVPVAAYLLVWIWLTNIFSAGNAAPLPYLPLLNPLELAQWLVLSALIIWWRSLPELSRWRLPSHAVAILAGASALALLTGAVLRSCHHFAGVAWDMDALFASRLAQAAVSIAWAICGVATMLIGNRRVWRQLWIVGAGLLAVVVLKLFLIELADQGGLYRIVSFIAVGVLLLIVGYFAPVPARLTIQGQTDERDEREQQGES